MKNLVDLLLNESIERAKKGNILEIELLHDGDFYWHTPEDDDFDEWDKLKDWEIAKCGENSIAIKIGDIKDIKTQL